MRPCHCTPSTGHGGPRLQCSSAPVTLVPANAGSVPWHPLVPPRPCHFRCLLLGSLGICTHKTPTGKRYVEALNRVGVGGPPTAAKLHKIPVILSATPLSAANVSQKKASRPLSVKVSVLQAHLQRIFVLDKETQTFSSNKNSQGIGFPYPWVFILLSLLTDSNPAVRAHIIHATRDVPQCYSPYLPKSTHVFCNLSKCFPLMQGKFTLPVPEKHSSCLLWDKLSLQRQGGMNIAAVCSQETLATVLYSFWKSKTCILR